MFRMNVGLSYGAAMHNKPLVPTRNDEAPLLAGGMLSDQLD